MQSVKVRLPACNSVRMVTKVPARAEALSQWQGADLAPRSTVELEAGALLLVWREATWQVVAVLEDGAIVRLLETSTANWSRVLRELARGLLAVPPAKRIAEAYVWAVFTLRCECDEALEAAKQAARGGSKRERDRATKRAAELAVALDALERRAEAYEAG